MAGNDVMDIFFGDLLFSAGSVNLFLRGDARGSLLGFRRLPDNALPESPPPNSRWGGGGRRGVELGLPKMDTRGL